MNRNLQFIYTAETVLVVFPSTLFLVLSFFGVPLLTSPNMWMFITPPFLWLGGLLGVTALWQMRERLSQINAICVPSQQTKIRFFWVKLIAGSVSAIAAPIMFMYLSPPDSGKYAGFLLLLCPLAVAAHWIWVLRNEKVFSWS